MRFTWGVKSSIPVLLRQGRGVGEGRENFPPGDIWQLSGDSLVVTTGKECAIGISWVKAKDVVRHPTAKLPATDNSLAPHVCSTEVRKLQCTEVCVLPQTNSFPQELSLSGERALVFK